MFPWPEIGHNSPHFGQTIPMETRNEIKEFGEEFNLKKIEPDLYKDEEYVDYEVVND